MSAKTSPYAKLWQRLLIVCILAFGLATSPVVASPPSSALFARSSIGRYWSSFSDYWLNIFRSQSAVVMMVLGTGAVSLVIITRGKWRK